jgi:hypothetical protein
MSTTNVRFSTLSLARQALVRLCQTLNRGTIEGLDVRQAEPMFNSPPVVLKDIKLDADEGPRPELALNDFVLSGEAVRLMKLLDGMESGSIRHIEVRAGIPRRILLETQGFIPAEARRTARSQSK